MGKAKEKDLSSKDKQGLYSEYQLLFNIVNSFDSKTLTIKAWSVTTSLAGIAVALGQDKNALLLLAAFSSLVFWVVEYYWKYFQASYFSRIEEIESYMRNETDHIDHLQISNRWVKHHRSMSFSEKRKLFMLYNIRTPHLYIFLVGLILYASNTFL